MYPIISTPRRSLLAYLLLPFLAGGCSLVGGGYNMIAGPDAIPARWAPPKEPTLVLVENFQNAAGGDVDNDRLGRYITQDLQTNKVAPLVDFQRVNTLRDQDPDAYRKMSIADIGRAVGAKQVVYVSVTDYKVEGPNGSEMVKGNVAVKVKVVDCATGGSRWPVDAAGGEPVTAETEFTARDEHGSDLPVRDKLNQALASRVGKLFHSWSPEYDNEEQTGSQTEEH